MIDLRSGTPIAAGLDGVDIRFWILVAAAAWFGAEFGINKRPIRMAVQFCVFAVCVTAAFSLGRFTGRLNPTIQGNMLIKNLTQSLVPILDDAGDDRTQLRSRLKKLDEDVIPTYESFDESRQAVEAFLDSYGMDYDSRIPMPETRSTETEAIKGDGG